MELVKIAAAGAPEAAGPYSHAVVAGDFVYCSGQVPLDPSTGQLVTGDIAQQTARILENLSAVLGAAGSGLDRVVKTTVFLVDIGEFVAMNEAYAKGFASHRPARSTIGVAALPRGARVEIECVALRR